jgi:hypothetical protein
MSDNNIIRSYCSSCRNETKHSILFEREVFGDFDEYKINKQFIECLGCENLSFRIVEEDYWDVSEEYDDEGEISLSHKTTIEIFPYFLRGHSEIKNSYNIPNQIGIRSNNFSI